MARESLTITKNRTRIISELFTNHRELPQNHFRVVHKSPRINENHPRIFSECQKLFESPRITRESFQSGRWEPSQLITIPTKHNDQAWLAIISFYYTIARIIHILAMKTT